MSSLLKYVLLFKENHSLTCNGITIEIYVKIAQDTLHKIVFYGYNNKYIPLVTLKQCQKQMFFCNFLRSKNLIINVIKNKKAATLLMVSMLMTIKGSVTAKLAVQ